jgi:hypothetical protein
LEAGKWVVHFAEDGKLVGTVEVYNGYTKSGWDKSIPEDLQMQCEDHAVEQYMPMMVERVRQKVQTQLPPGWNVGVIPIKR